MNPPAACARRALALSLLVALTTACGLTPPQRADVVAFGRSAVALADIGRDEFLTTYDDVVEINRRRYLLGDDGVDPAELGGPMTHAALESRLLALDALAGYGHALVVLLGEADATDRAHAARSLVTGLRRVDELEVDEREAGMLESAMTSLGGLLTEGKRRRAVEQVVDIVHDDVVMLAELVASEFDTRDGAWVQAYDLAALEYRGRALDEGWTAPMRRELALDTGARRARLEVVGAKIQTAAEQLARAQEALRASLDDTRVNRLEVQQFVAFVDELRAARAALDPRGRRRPPPDDGAADPARPARPTR